MRGRKMSSANFVWPVHLARASTLRKGLPTTLRLSPFCFIIARVEILARDAFSTNAPERADKLGSTELRHTSDWSESQTRYKDQFAFRSCNHHKQPHSRSEMT